MHVRYTRCTSEEKSGCLLEEHAFLCVVIGFLCRTNKTFCILNENYFVLEF